MSEAQPQPAPAMSQSPTPDIALRPILLSALLLVSVSVLTLLGMDWLLTSVTSRQARRDAPPAPMAWTASPLPPEPRLQVHPAQDLQHLRAEEEALLHSYGWIDQQAGTVRMPIERAMELLVARGLPSRPALPDGGSPVPQERP